MGQASNILTFGEIMLRLRSPDRHRLLQGPWLEAGFGGAEANVAISLANFGQHVRFVSVLPEGPVADAAIRKLRAFGVDTTCIVRAGERMGIYFMETGAGPRSSSVFYDRSGTSMATAKRGDLPWKTMLQDATWLHVSGITPGISPSAAELTLEAAKVANQFGVKVSCDLNFRRALWQYGVSAQSVMRELMRYVHICVAGREDCQKSLGIGTLDRRDNDTPDLDKYEKLTGDVLDRFTNLKSVAITLRESWTAETGTWSAVLRDADGFHCSGRYQLTTTVDRVGVGDSFAAALIYGLTQLDGTPTALEFAVAASVLKHTVHGDFNRVSVSEISEFLAGNRAGRIRR